MWYRLTLSNILSDLYKTVLKGDLSGVFNSWNWAQSNVRHCITGGQEVRRQVGAEEVSVQPRPLIPDQQRGRLKWARSTDDRWYTERRGNLHAEAGERESVRASREKEGGKNVPNVQQQKTRKESVTADFDLVTIVAYSNFSTRTSWTSQPQPDFQDCESRHSQNFNPETFSFSFSRADLPLRNEEKLWSLHSLSLWTSGG